MSLGSCHLDFLDTTSGVEETIGKVGVHILWIGVTNFISAMVGVAATDSIPVG